MVLEWSLLLGAGLLILSLVGIFGPDNPDSWLAWCDFFGAWATYFVAADIKPNSTRAQRVGCPLALAVGLFIACFLAMRGKPLSWLIWPTFGFACAFLILSFFRAATTRVKKDEMGQLLSIPVISNSDSNSDKEDQYVLCLNTGSSSLKFSLYSRRNLESAVMSGSADKIGLLKSHLRIQVRGRLFLDEDIPLPTHEKAVIESFAALRRAQLPIPIACVHRVVHGGAHLLEPCLITGSVQRELNALVALAPLHIPSELAVIKATAHVYPKVPQIACFDTAFHQRMPDVAKRLPLPKNFWDGGIRRYGFHGLSYESIVSQLQNQLNGRTIIAHLGNGCSMVALRDGVPQDTTMGLTPTGGLMMGTRSGDLDPGVLFYLFKSLPTQTQDVVKKTEQTINDKSGLLGVSGISRNMEELLKAESDSPAAREAIELFCYQAIKFIGSLYAVLGGLDRLIFTGGIGENSSIIRQRICEGLTFLDLGHETSSSCQVKVLQTNENLIMAKHAFRILSEEFSELTRLSS